VAATLFVRMAVADFGAIVLDRLSALYQDKGTSLSVTVQDDDAIGWT